MAEDTYAEGQLDLAFCEGLARTLARPGTRGINGVEYDDLVQEGLIACWQARQRGITPSQEVVRFRMVDYQRWLGRQGVPYDKMLPIEDLD